MPRRPPVISGSTLWILRFQVNEAIKELSDYIEEIYGIDEKQFTIHNDINANGHTITNLPTPVDNDDAAPKEYVDDEIAAVADAQFLLLAADSDLANSRIFTIGHGLDGTDAGAGSTFTLDVDETELNHNLLGNLAVGDVHTHYFLLAGRAGGQIAYGGTLAGQSLALLGSIHADSGPITLNTNLSVDADGDISLSKISSGATITQTVYGTGGSAPTLIGQRALGIAAGDVVVNDSALYLWSCQGWDGSAFVEGVEIAVKAAATWSDTEAGTKMVFSTATIGDVTRTVANRMRIDGYGNLAIGTTTPNATMAAGFYIKTTTAPTAVAADTAALYTKDANAEAGKSWWHAMGEDDVEHQLAGIIYKATTGLPATKHEGSVAVNTYDDRVDLYMDSVLGWREFLRVENADFRGYEAIRMCCDNGTTFPSPNNLAQWLYRSDLKTLYIFQSGWKSIISFGAVNLYVDGTLGTDDVGYGYGPGADATLTIQYAINRIPPVSGGNVVINIAEGTYNEDLTIGGKTYSGNFSITFKGVLTVIQSGTSSGDGVKGTGVTQGSLLDAGNLAGHENRLMYLDSDGDEDSANAYRIIDTVDVGGDNASVVGSFASKPLSGENYIIKDWGTEISGTTSFTVRPGMFKLIFTNIHFSGSTKTFACDQADVTFNRCKFTNGHANPKASSLFMMNTCYMYMAAVAPTLRIETASISILSRCKLVNNEIYGGYCIWAFYGSQAIIESGTVLDCTTPNSNKGMAITLNGVGGCYSIEANGYPRIRNCAIGLQAYNGGQIGNTSFNVYTANTADEDVNPVASYGYID